MGRFEGLYDKVDQSCSAIQLGMIEVTANWCETVFGLGSLSSALDDLCQSVGAEAGMLVRNNNADATTIRVASYDNRQQVAGVKPLVQSFAAEHFGQLFDAARPGTLWLGSSVSEGSGDEATPLGVWQHRRALRELVVIVLTSGIGTRDHLELHFRERLSSSTYTALATLAPTLARTWAQRRAGLVTQSLMSERSPRRLAAPSGAKRGNLLAASNPAGLSRTEFRVCLLLSKGLSVSRVASEMSLAETTIRSHLRSIYAKTEAHGLADLVYRILVAPKGEDNLQQYA